MITPLIKAFEDSHSVEAETYVVSLVEKENFSSSSNSVTKAGSLNKEGESCQ